MGINNRNCKLCKGTGRFKGRSCPICNPSYDDYDHSGRSMDDDSGESACA